MQATHRHLLVDEFQDLTPAHVLLIRLLAMPALDVFGVGDDDQTIYDHAGADPRFLVDYADFFPGAEATALEVNYRCAAAIVAGAATLLGYNRIRVEKRIRAAEGADADRVPRSRSAATLPAMPASEIAALISAWRLTDGVDDAEIAILARVNSLLLAPQIALWSAGVPLRSSVGPEVLERAGVAAALAWLRVALDPEGLIPADLETVRRRPSRGAFRAGSASGSSTAARSATCVGAERGDRRRAGRRQGRRARRRHRAARRRGPRRRARRASCSRWFATGSASAARWRCSTAPRAARAPHRTSTTSRA